MPERGLAVAWMMRLHQRLIAGDFPNCRKLTDDLEVSAKTIQRDRFDNSPSRLSANASRAMRKILEV